MNNQGVIRSLFGLGFWKYVWDRNPFYPLSAVLLLFGIHRLSTDPFFLPAEASKLIFNFGALEVYELLAVVTALFLLRKSIRYDAALLATLDFVLALTPFILITQAVLIGKFMAAILSAAAAVLVVTRIAFLNRLFGGLPRSLFVVGGLVLLANTSLPFLYRPLIEEDVAHWAGPSRLGWFLVLPPLQLTSLWIKPKPNQAQPWWPALLFHLWIAATAVHLRCVDYISNLPFQPESIAPVLWSTVWTLILKAPRWLPENRTRLLNLTWPMLVTLALLPAFAKSGSYVLATLAGLNAILLVLRNVRYRHAWSFHCAWISILFAVIALPAPIWSWSRFVPAVDPWLLGLGLAMAGCGLLTSGLYAALVGVGAVIAVGISNGFHLPIQLALGYMVLHSLLWSHHPYRLGRFWQQGIVTLLIAHACLWVNHLPTQASLILRYEGILLCAVCAGIYCRRSIPWHLALAGPLLLIAQLIPPLLQLLRATPQGILILLSSFLVFALGTLLALGKRHLQAHRTSVFDSDDTSQPG